MTSPVLLVRLRPGVVGESRRVVHVVPLPTGDGVPDALTAYCGEQITPGTAEVLPTLGGMPCVSCFAIATPLFAQLLADRLRVLVPDDPYILSTRSNLAGWTGEAGDVAEARDLFARLLADCERVLGSDHPQTLTTRNSLAYWTGEAGDVAEAHDLSAQLLADCERVLGPDHPQTLTTRNSLARWTGQAGDAAGAREMYAQLLADRLRVLGPDHPVDPAG